MGLPCVGLPPMSLPCVGLPVLGPSFARLTRAGQSRARIGLSLAARCPGIVRRIDVPRLLAGVCHVNDRPAAAERLVQGYRIRQHLLVVGQQCELRGKQ
jgi:hypothetical protein